MAINILIVDDHSMVREGLRRMLSENPDIGGIAEAKNGQIAVEEALRSNPDVVIMDYDMPHYNGIYGTRMLLKEQPESKVIMLSMYQNKDVIIESIKVGVKGFVLKEGPMSELVEAIKTVHGGGTWFKGQVAEIITPHLIAAATGVDVESLKKTNLTPRELEVLCMIAEGFTAQKISEKLFISKRTVEVHKAKIFKKLNIHNTTELIRYALQKGLIKIP